MEAIGAIDPKRFNDQPAGKHPGSMRCERRSTKSARIRTSNFTLVAFSTLFKLTAPADILLACGYVLGVPHSMKQSKGHTLE
jgi:hypothetical protein